MSFFLSPRPDGCRTKILALQIVIARNSARIVHVSEAVAREAAAYYYRPPLQYNRWAVNIAYVVLLWIGWVACVVSTVLMFLAASYDKMHPSAFGASTVATGSTTALGGDDDHEGVVLPTTTTPARPSGQSSFDFGTSQPPSSSFAVGEKLGATDSARSSQSQLPPTRSLGHTVL